MNDNPNLTAMINQHSIESIRHEIAKKTNYKPYFANGLTSENVVTDMDHTPYTRWFRGVYYFPDPIIMEREAGWRPIKERCYNINAPIAVPDEPKHCFEAACSTIYPCYPQTQGRYADRMSNNEMTNNACVVQYR